MRFKSMYHLLIMKRCDMREILFAILTVLLFAGLGVLLAWRG